MRASYRRNENIDMFRSHFVAAFLACAVLTPTAQAATLLTPEGEPIGGKFQSWVDHSRVPVPETVFLALTACPSQEGTSCTGPGLPIFLSPDQWSPRAALYHELGHQFDYQVVTDRDRVIFLRLLGVGGPWRSGGPDSPHERFAEAYGLCAKTGLSNRSGRGRVNGAYGYTVTKRRHWRLCLAIQRLG